MKIKKAQVHFILKNIIEIHQAGSFQYFSHMNSSNRPKIIRIFPFYRTISRQKLKQNKPRYSRELIK